jgi:nucleoside 2-deoxyribosyltransferase
VKEVFISYSLADSHLSKAVSDALKDAGLKVCGVESIKTGAEWATAISDQIRDSNCLIAVTSGHPMNANVAFEIGLATALKKPVYLIVSKDSDHVPFDLSWATNNVHVLPAGNFEFYAKKIAGEIPEPA